MSDNIVVSMERIERVARQMCHRIGIDPDAEVSLNQPQLATWRRNIWFIPGIDYRHPAWQAFAEDARLALEEVAREIVA